MVIGSGPAGVSAAKALLERGRRVLMLDGGVQLEDERREIVERMCSETPDKWTETDLAAIKEGMEAGLDGVPLKRLYGSDFPYQDVEKFVDLSYDGVDMTMSLARGGLSNVWGAGVLPFAQREIDDWPITASDLDPYYRRVFSFVPLSAVKDGLCDVLPMHCDNPVALKAGRQSEAFLRDLRSSSGRLRSKGITFGTSRLAVRADSENGKPGCAYCGLCLYGCPYDLIYCTKHTLQEMLEDPNFTYVPDTIVDRLEESKDKVTVFGRNRLTGDRTQYAAEKVFLGCGVISTTKLLLESLAAYDRPVVMRDSQYFLVPLLRLRGIPGVRTEELHCLAQIFLEILDERVSHRGIHISVYTHSGLFEQVVRKALGPAGRLGPVVDALLGRILVFGGYLHSDDSLSAEMRLQPGEGGRPPTMTMKAIDNPRMKAVVRRLLRNLMSCAWEFKGIPAFPAMRTALPGRGYHAGATFPMRSEPKEFECDSLGRPHGMRRVHVLDATCFPSIPATNITLTVMAHGYRVGDLCCEA